MHLGKSYERFGLSLNAMKTQVMVIGRHTSSITVMYSGAPLYQVKQLIYLGASFTEKRDTIKEVKMRVGTCIGKRADDWTHVHGTRPRGRPITISLKDFASQANKLERGSNYAER